MPVIDLPLKKVNKILGKNLTLEELEEYSLQLGADIDDKREDGVKVEYNPNRPDFCSIPGFARALKGIIGIETGLVNYKLKNSGMTVKVEKSVSAVRPFIKCAIVRGVSLDEDDIADLMNTQETLHWVVGRDRRINRSRVRICWVFAVRTRYRFLLQGGSQWPSGTSSKLHCWLARCYQQ